MTAVLHPASGRARWAGVEAFLEMRAIPGLESVTDGRFHRKVPGGCITVRGTPTDDAVVVEHRHLEPVEGAADPIDVLAAVRRVADLDTDLDPIAAHLATDPVLAERLAIDGLGRLPGAFDRFEVAVRAIVGQQVSVAGARTLLGRLVAETASDQPIDRFPSPATVAGSALDLGMPRRRRDTIRALATAVAEGRVTLDPALGTDTVTDQLLAIPGIGPWTAGYVAMRALGDPDGWPAGDLGLRRSLGIDGAELERRAERWRPWRAYAALLLWRTDPNTTSPSRLAKER